VTQACPDDRGRAAVYEAEEQAFGGTALDDTVAFTVLARLGGDVVTGPWWSAAGGPAVNVLPARADAASSTARAGTGTATVRIAAPQCTAATLAHELAHVLAGVGHGHDARFRAAHVDVAELLGGHAAGAQLRAAYQDFGLAVSPRPWPPPMRAEGDSFTVVT
jgi:hypothetical protein